MEFQFAPIDFCFAFRSRCATFAWLGLAWLWGELEKWVWWGLGHTMVGWHSSGVGVHQADWLICAIHKTYKTFGEAGKFIPEALGKAMETYLKISEVAQYS